MIHAVHSLKNLQNSKFPESMTNNRREIRAGEWFSYKKRALLSEYGVGTVDQAIMPILPVKHQFVRLWGLANRVVIFDEIHAYDAYTGTLLIQLLRWLLALGSSVVLLSATLPSSIRQKLARLVNVSLPEPDAKYPRLSVFRTSHAVTQKHFEADPARRRSLRLLGIQPDLPDMHPASRASFCRRNGLGLGQTFSVRRIFIAFSQMDNRWREKGNALASNSLMERRSTSFTPVSLPIGGRKEKSRH